MRRVFWVIEGCRFGEGVQVGGVDLGLCVVGRDLISMGEELHVARLHPQVIALPYIDHRHRLVTVANSLSRILNIKQPSTLPTLPHHPCKVLLTAPQRIQSSSILTKQKHTLIKTILRGALPKPATTVASDPARECIAEARAGTLGAEARVRHAGGCSGEVLLVCSGGGEIG